MKNDAKKLQMLYLNDTEPLYDSLMYSLVSVEEFRANGHKVLQYSLYSLKKKVIEFAKTLPI